VDCLRTKASGDHEPLEEITNKLIMNRDLKIEIQAKKIVAEKHFKRNGPTQPISHAIIRLGEGIINRKKVHVKRQFQPFNVNEYTSDQQQSSFNSLSRKSCTVTCYLHVFYS